MATSTWAPAGRHSAVVVSYLKFSCLHGTMTTRLLGAHCALQATILLSESRNAMHLPEVLALIDSLSFMTVSFRAIG